MVVNIRIYMRQVDEVISTINSMCEKVHKVNLNLTKLISLGENTILWKESNYYQYHLQRLYVDSILVELKNDYEDFVGSEKIDSLRLLLTVKEAHLFHYRKAIQSWEKIDSLLTDSLPHIAERLVKMRTVTRKKKGIWGLFGKKETMQVPYRTDELEIFVNRLISVQAKRDSQMSVYTDSLRFDNKVLNQKLCEFTSFWDSNRIRSSLVGLDWKILESKQKSFHMLLIVMLVTISMFIILFFIIRTDLMKEKKIKTNLKQVIHENENLLEMRKKIILTISHDIRGPIGNIHNCADLASETREKKKREIYLDDIRHSCHHILHLVNDLMDAYRMNEVGDFLNEMPFYLDRFLKRISDEFSRKASSKALILCSEHENSNVKVKGDADKLEQVLVNLLTNAIKFTPSGTISFHSKYSEDKLQIEIRDTGIGMNNETLKRIFAPFERAAQHINSEGFGLGLFLTKGLVKVLNGTMEVVSEPGEGSAFKLKFPLCKTDEPVEEDPIDDSPIGILPQKVLIVDDDSIQLKIAEDMLGRKGIVCTTCMNIKDVIMALRESDYDMVLTDIQMPNIDGFGLLKLLRNSDIGNSKTVPVVVMTARNDGNTGIYEKEGFAGCIHKPFNIHTLLTFLSDVMSQTRARNIRIFDFSHLLEDSDEHLYILSLIINESEKDLEELKTAIKTVNREIMRKTIHRMIPVWEMLGQEHLLRNFQERLYDENCSDETIRECTIQIIEWIESLIKESENELKRYENTNC